MSAAKKKGAAIVAVSWSHERPRVELRRPSDGGTPPLPDAAAAVPFQDPATGRIVDGAAAARRRWLVAKGKAAADTIATLDPTHAPSWLSPHIRDTAEYAATLRMRFPDPVLGRMVLHCAGAHAFAIAYATLGATGDAAALKESRMWMGEHRAALRELSALAGLATQLGRKAPTEQEMREAGRPRTRRGA